MAEGGIVLRHVKREEIVVKGMSGGMSPGEYVQGECSDPIVSYKPILGAISPSDTVYCIRRPLNASGV